jgi:hypothetical protein
MNFLPPLSLVIAMGTMIVIATTLAVLVERRLRRASPRTATAIAIVGAGLLVAHALWLNGNPWFTRMVPAADAIVSTNFSPLFVALLVAAAWRRMTVRWQRWLMVLVLASVCVLQAYGPLFGRVPVAKPPRIANGVHRQSTSSTCSAAAAATLLGAIGIDATEQEMIELCLTRESGTLQLGLYRGLRRKAPGARVEILNNDLPAIGSSPVPVIVSLGSATPGWRLLERRLGHSVVILSRDAEGRYDIADPVTGGRYPMREVQFRRLWTGEAMRVVK